ncbi:glycoside hydrolase family 36 protein [Paenibacillus koleovorans]|uniref:glycoside hydrolase family 36 protein n=1 Tax=Paenibacillus koleovorans TaxID=121608 RepID=UPI000FDB6AA3|nr:glycoside hydrolase family 36 protein [Paenibacillus koleovorans]
MNRQTESIGSTTNVEKTAKMTLHAAEGALSFESHGVKLAGGVPEAMILVGTEETEYVWKPFAGTDTGTGSAKYDQSPVTTPGGEGVEHSWIWSEPSGFLFQWIVTELKGVPGFTVRGSFTNGSNEPVRLRSFTLLAAPAGGVRCEGEPSDWFLSSMAHETRIGTMGETLPSLNDCIIERWKGYNMPVPFKLSEDAKNTDGRYRFYSDFLTLYTDQGNKGITWAAVGPPRADVGFECCVDDGAMALRITSQMTDIVVDPGEVRQAQEVLVLGGAYAEVSETVFRWLAATHGQRTQQGAKFGWCSWYDLMDKITEETVLATVAEIRDRSESCPFDVIQIDDGFQRQVGDWRRNDKFPGEDWSTVVGAIRGTGAEAGIWLAPLAIHNTTELFAEHPDWLQRDRQGEISGQAHNWGATSHWLDPTNPGVEAWLRQLMTDMRNEGFTYFKIDFNTIGGGCRFYDSKKTRLQVHRELYRLYREAIGEQSYLLSCWGFNRGVLGYADAVRIGPDSCPIWSHAHPCTLLEAIRATGMNAAANGLLLATDPDVTYVRVREQVDPPGGEERWGRAMHESELRTWHSFVGLAGGLAITSDPLEKADCRTPQAVRMMEILNPPAPEKGVSLQGGVDKNHTRFGFTAERTWGKFASFLLWNPEQATRRLELTTAATGQVGEQFHLWSFWNETYLGVVDADHSVELAPHEPALLRATPWSAPGEPLIVGSTLHISMGAAEIGAFRANADSVELELTAAGAESGAVYIYSKRQLELSAATGCRVGSLERVGATDVWRLSLLDRQRSQPQVIKLQCHD